jgi:ribosomal protein L21E
MSNSGYRYSAGAAVVGPQRDTLRVAVVVVNESNRERVLPLAHCRLQGDPVKARVAEGGRSWNSEINEVKPHPVFHDSTGQVVMEACTADLLVRTFPRGARAMSVLKVPIREILGDSLPSGRYRVTARLTSNGGDGRKLDAGEVVLR